MNLYRPVSGVLFYASMLSTQMGIRQCRPDVQVVGIRDIVSINLTDQI